MGPLRNGKHEMFAQAVAGGNGVEAAYAAAGYTPGPSAWKLRNRPEVSARIAALQREAAERAGVSAGYLTAQLLPLASSNIVDAIEVDERGRIKLKNLTKLSREITASISAVKIDPESGTVDLKLWNKIEANGAIAKIAGLAAPERLDVDLSARVKDDRELTANELVRRVGFYASQALCRQLADEPIARGTLARALRALGDEVLCAMDPHDVAAVEALAASETPPLERARQALSAVARAAHGLLDDGPEVCRFARALHQMADAAIGEARARAEGRGELFDETAMI